MITGDLRLNFPSNADWERIDSHQTALKHLTSIFSISHTEYSQGNKWAKGTPIFIMVTATVLPLGKIRRCGSFRTRVSVLTYVRACGNIINSASVITTNIVIQLRKKNFCVVMRKPTVASFIFITRIYPLRLSPRFLSSQHTISWVVLFRGFFLMYGWDEGWRGEYFFILPVSFTGKRESFFSARYLKKENCAWTILFHSRASLSRSVTFGASRNLILSLSIPYTFNTTQPSLFNRIRNLNSW